MPGASSCLFRTSVGKKFLMAFSGFLLVGFLMAHLLGNLLIYLGPNAMNSYAEHLRNLGPLLWVARIILLTTVITHIVTAVQLTLENRAARPVPYKAYEPVRTTYAARTMAMSGLIVLAFIVYHILHFTLKVTNPEISHGIDSLGRHDVYGMVVKSFQNPFIVLAYVVAQILLAMHLAHGLSSLLQSLGILKNECCRAKLQCAARGFAALLFTGFISIPLSILFGLVR